MLNVYNVSKSYLKNKNWFSNEYQQVLHEVSLHIEKGQCLGIVGESGSGKSTLARLILGVEKADAGTITFESRAREQTSEDSTPQDTAKNMRISAVFQDYLSSVNPAMSVSQILLEALDIARVQIPNRQQLTQELLDKVGLPRTLQNAYAHELSGGQLQRICIARALSTYPQLIVLDEPTNSLDVLNQMKILDLLQQLKKDNQLTYLLISHDLQAVSYLSDQIVFFQGGEVIENIKTKDLSSVQSSYAKKLLQSVQILKK